MDLYNFPWDLGSHIPWKGNMEDTLKNGINDGMYAIQFCLGSPKSFKRIQLSEEDIAKAQKLCQRFPTHVFSHAPYLYNLCGKKTSLAWNGDSYQDAILTNILGELEYELGVLSSFQNKRNGVVIHPGNYPDRNIGLKTIAESINKINFPEGSKLLLENSAGQGTSLATTFEEIKTIYDHVDEKKKKHIGVCIDTCHIFAYGSYDLSICKEVDKLFENFDKVLGMELLTVIHLNDSQAPLGSRKDRHGLIGTGHIWGKSFDSLVYLLDKCSSYEIPLVLETNPSDIKVFLTLI
jgi:apurinic endonuclease APN1